MEFFSRFVCFFEMDLFLVALACLQAERLIFSPWCVLVCMHVCVLVDRKWHHLGDNTKRDITGTLQEVLGDCTKGDIMESAWGQHKR